jgi:hypothetical protein
MDCSCQKPKGFFGVLLPLFSFRKIQERENGIKKGKFVFNCITNNLGAAKSTSPFDLPDVEAINSMPRAESLIRHGRKPVPMFNAKETLKFKAESY